MIQKALKMEYIKSSYAPDGKESRTYEVVAIIGEYAPFNNLEITRGKNKGKIHFNVNEFDYTLEDERRKVRWKLSNNRKENKKPLLGHISKLYKVTEEYYVGDLKGTRDRFIIQANETFTSLFFFILPNCKDDYTIPDQLDDGLLDDEMAFWKEKTMSTRN